jgi:hypothetical protein
VNRTVFHRVIDSNLLGLEYLRATLGDCLENRGGICDRAADHSQDRGGSPLVLERLLRLVDTGARFWIAMTA